MSEPTEKALRTPHWRVLYAFVALGSGDRLRAIRDSGLFHPDRLHFIAHCPPHLQARCVADDVVKRDAVDAFVAVCEATPSPRSEEP